MALQLRQIELSAKTVYGPELDNIALCVSLVCCHKSFTTIVFGNHDFPLMASNFGNLTAFTHLAILSVHMHKNDYLWTSDLHSDNAIQFLDPDFLIQHNILAIWGPFLLIFALDMLNVHFRSSWPTDLESVSRVAYLTMKVSTKFEIWSRYHHLLPSHSIIATDTLHYLDLLTLVSGHTWRVTWSTPPPSLKILRLSVLDLWVLTSPTGYHTECFCSHCACAISCDLCVDGKFFPHNWNPWLPFAYSLYSFYGAKMTFTGRLLSAHPMLKLFSDKDF